MWRIRVSGGRKHNLRTAGGAAIVLTTLALTLVPALPAQAAASVTALLADPGVPLTVGQTNVGLSLTIQNLSTAPDDTVPYTVDGLLIAPSCAGFSNLTCTSPDAGVFGLSASGVGRANTACAGTIFTLGPPDGSGVSTVVIPGGSFTLQPPSNANLSKCIIDFTVSVMKMPNTDVFAGTAGVQTYFAGFAHFANSGAGVSQNTGTARALTVQPASGLTLVTQASPTVRQGSNVFDTGTLQGGSNPTGTITFNLYGPNDPTCTGAIAFAGLTPVSGNGNYQSGMFAPTAPGVYRWTAKYNGDANNNPVTANAACNDPNEVVTVQPSTPGDYNADHTTDVAVYRPSTNVWYELGVGAQTWGAAGDIPVPADFTGDGKTDPTVFRPSTGVWYVLGGSTGQWGVSTDVPVPADYNGDGKSEFAVYRPSTGVWYIGGPTPSAITFGTQEDVPVPGDYDGDGKADVAVYRPSTGVWYIGGASPQAIQFGAAGDIPVPGDYNGDGKTDIAVFRPSTNTWYVYGQFASIFGAAGDIPQPGDYNGDGKTDVGVYRPSTGAWYVLNQSSTIFGQGGDIPLVLPYAIRRAYFGSASSS